MKLKSKIGLLSLAVAGCASAQGLYYTGSEAQESIPLKWVVGTNFTYDDNVAPGGVNDGEEAYSVNPYVGLSFVNITPQTTWDVYARLGLVYYIDQPDGAGVKDTYTQARAGVDFVHRFSERLRFSSNNFIAYELEPDYSQGVASTRQVGEYLYWQTDNAVGFRWSERFATYTGFQLTGLSYDDVDNNDRFTWTGYNQFRYQLTPQSVLTAEYRYAQTTANDDASDATDQYLLGGIEHRFSPNTILIARAGAQLRDVDGDSSTSPYLELALNSQVNSQFLIRSFARYSMENYDTVQTNSDGVLAEYSDRRTLRIGVSGEYTISQVLSLFGGVDYIPTSYQGGNPVDDTSVAEVGDESEDIINAYIGASFKFTDNLFGTVSYNFTQSDSDLPGRDYDRNRVSVGVRAEF